MDSNLGLDWYGTRLVSSLENGLSLFFWRFVTSFANNRIDKKIIYKILVYYLRNTLTEVLAKWAPVVYIHCCLVN